uniref:Ig-like domain-containing protein n=1 Tax=Esox lucius TaxID=8010 RepID=A0A6Q2Z304_ESOLU
MSPRSYYREGGTTMSLRTGSVSVVFLWSLTGVAVVLGQSVKYTSQKICALKGSTVDLSCSYTNPKGYTVTSTEWYYRKNGNWIEIRDYSAGRVSYLGNKVNDCTLRITDLREEDSASYQFTHWHLAKYAYVTLSVTGLQVLGYDKNKLTCRTSCPLTEQPTYIWYKNGQPFREDTSILNVHYFGDEDRYSCGVKGHENLRSPAVCKKTYSVTYTSQSICALKGSTVDLSCSYTYPRYHNVRTTMWYYWKNRNWKEIPNNNAGRVLYRGNKVSDCTLRITDVSEEDSTSYYFTFKPSDLTKYENVSLTVTDVVLEMEPTSVSERNRVTLTCTTKCSLDPNPEYSWYKNGQPIENTKTNSAVHILSVSSEDAGRYSCGVKGHETLLSPEKTLNVTYSCIVIGICGDPAMVCIINDAIKHPELHPDWQYVTL